MSGILHAARTGAVLLLFLLLQSNILLAQSNEMPLVNLRVCSEVHASSVVDFFQGNKKNYGSIGANRSNPQKALGSPEKDATNNFVSLGFGGGFITLSFNHAIVNGPGTDLTISETSFNTPGCNQTPETAKVYAAQNLTDWILLGSTCHDGAFDLGPLQWAKYVRIEDASDRGSTKFNGNSDGFDVDGIAGSYCERGPIQPVFECLTNDYDEDGIPDGYTSAIFGYHNWNLHSIDLPFSNFNIFTANPADRGQPISFIPGRKRAAFATPLDNTPISWAVDLPLSHFPQLTATASPNSEKVCGSFVAPERVRPVFECYLPGENNSFAGYFGYQNENAYPVEVFPGTHTSTASNTFHPGPADRGQPAVFESGRVQGAFSVPSANGGNLVWTLEYENTGRKTATASTNGRQCAAPYPRLDCVTRLPDGSYQARFGYTNPEPFALQIEAGPLNSVTPGTADQDQITTFEPGTHLDAYQPIFSGNEDRTWTVHNAALTASATDESLRCEPVKQPACSLGFPPANEQSPRLQAEFPQQDGPSPATHLTCGGSSTSISVLGSLGFKGIGQVDTSQLNYSWTLDCNDPAAVITKSDTLTPEVTVFAPGTLAQNSSSGIAATCHIVLTVRHDDPLSEPAVCEGTITVDACSFDCLQEINGSASLDSCGVCNGDNSSCAGCDGVPDSGLIVDQCGLCGGDGQSCALEKDCLGKPGGSATFDRCGVCNGDGSSCLGCTIVPVEKEQYALDSGARTQSSLVRSASRVYLRTAKKKRRARRFARRARRTARKLYQENWALAWSLPVSIRSCTNSAFCTKTNEIGVALDAYNKNSEALRDIGLAVIKRIRPRGKRWIKRRKRNLRQSAHARHAFNLNQSATVPRTDSHCSGAGK